MAKSLQDLADRTRSFAADIRSFIRKTPRTIASLSDCRNLIRSSGAVGSNYIQANGAPSTRCFVKQMRNCRRDARHCQHWLRLLDANLEKQSETMRKKLLNEAYELDRIFSVIITKTLEKSCSDQS